METTRKETHRNEPARVDAARIDAIITAHAGKPGALLGILEDVQKSQEGNYLPERVLEYISRATGVPASRVYGVATFYSYFNLAPQGRHTVVVCRGTACHTRGSKGILDEALALLGCDQGEGEEEAGFTTADAEFSVRTVACFGQCALAPVVAVDGIIHSSVSSATLVALIKGIQKGGKA